MGDIASCCGTLLYVMIEEMSQDSTVGQVTGYGPDELGLNVGRVKGFSLLQNIQTSSGAHPASYSVCATVLSHGSSGLAAREGDNSPPPSSAEGNNAWSCTSAPAVCCHIVKRGDCTVMSVVQECNCNINL
jgi:hypothetical protein